MALHITLRQADTVIAVRTIADLTTVLSDYVFELTALEKSRITNLNDLVLSMQSGSTGEMVSSVRIELSAPTPAANDSDMLLQAAFFALF